MSVFAGFASELGERGPSSTPGPKRCSTQGEYQGPLGLVKWPRATRDGNPPVLNGNRIGARPHSRPQLNPEGYHRAQQRPLPLGDAHQPRTTTTRGSPVEGQVEGLPHPGRRRKLHRQRVDPLPPPWGNMVNYVADPPPALLCAAKLGRGYPPPGVGNSVNYARGGSNSGEGRDAWIIEFTHNLATPLH